MYEGVKIVFFLQRIVPDVIFQKIYMKISIGYSNFKLISVS
ncbi:hypothetical protein GXM_02448 [Nostoc sphaeroides CCNUC1]|uniref:Uncharacterized protein n=1 Tax=Nostoc sphaeroides CCNUC1 TaxID=2653204 RepID=A0A5P8VX16_9NOSO|nr:hypothetical protein GXM_02448 [Nostoc sphaeroides CCNUC1]